MKALSLGSAEIANYGEGRGKEYSCYTPWAGQGREKSVFSGRIFEGGGFRSSKS